MPVADAQFLRQKRPMSPAPAGSRCGQCDCLPPRQSFVPGEITPEEPTGLAWSWPGENRAAAFIVCTHIDKAHVPTTLSGTPLRWSMTASSELLGQHPRAVHQPETIPSASESYSIVEAPKRRGQSYNMAGQFGRALNSKEVPRHAIPTMEFVQKGFDGLTEGEKKLLSLVCCKLLCAVAAPHVYEAVTATFTAPGTVHARAIHSPPGWKEMSAASRRRSRPRRPGRRSWQGSCRRSPGPDL